MREFEIVIIGGGPAGYQAALEFGGAGIDILLIDKRKENIGGTCLNVGCIPAKSYIEASTMLTKIPHIKELGIDLELHGFDIKKLQKKTIALQNEIRSGVLWMLEKANVQTLFGKCSFVDENTITVDGEEIHFKKIIIATGSKPRQLPQLPLDSKYILSSSDIFELQKLPSSITIVGSGAIACEMVSFFSAFDIDITLISRSKRILSNLDEDISKALTRVFKKNNINIITSTNVKSYSLEDGNVVLVLDSKETIKSELVLSVVGREPNSDELHLQNANISIDKKGFIEVTKSFETSQQNIFAIGDCIDTPAFAHTAHTEAEIVAQNIINNETKTNTHISPSTIFTYPQIATCGLSQNDAQKKGIDIETKKAYFKANSKTKILGNDAGFAKVILSKEDGVILGASIIGVEATEIIHEIVFAIEKKFTLDELQDVIHAHPTVAEIITYL
jgi:dihydrolipoamide dehydrogenase